MAPEQARGKTVDKRADIWAFGAVLFEMLTGRRAFDGDSVSDTLAAVLTREPDYDRLPRDTPPTVRALLHRTLERDARQRLCDIGEARVTLSSAEVDSNPPRVGGRVAATASRSSRIRMLAVIATGVVIAVAAAAWTMGRSSSSSPEGPMLSLGIDAGGDTPLAGVGWVGMNWVGPTAILSPDGRVVVFIARGPAGGRWQLYTRRLDELKAARIAGTEGAYAPFFSPDGRWIAFFAGGRLSKVALAGGSVATICEAPHGVGGAWTPDGVIVFAPKPDGPLFRVSADGGTPTPFTALRASGETTHRWPQLLPGGTQILFTTQDDANPLRAGSIEVQPLAGGERKVVQTGGLYGRYAPSGHLLYVQDGKLVAAPFDLSRLQVSGRPVPIVDDVVYSPLSGTAQYSLSDSGLLAYRRAYNAKRVLQWMDFAGQLQKIRDIPAEYKELRFSPDGSRLLLAIDDGGQSDVWTYDIAGDRMTRLTFYADNDRSPIWSPDASRLAYASWRGDVGTFNIFAHRADGTGEDAHSTRGAVGGSDARRNACCGDSIRGSTAGIDGARRELLRVSASQGGSDVAVNRLVRRDPNQTFAALQTAAQRLESGRSFTISSQTAPGEEVDGQNSTAENGGKRLKKKSVKRLAGRQGVSGLAF
jgi:protein tyrosine kinase/WD40 repeat protein